MISWVLSGEKEICFIPSIYATFSSQIVHVCSGVGFFLLAKLSIISPCTWEALKQEMKEKNMM